MFLTGRHIEARFAFWHVLPAIEAHVVLICRPLRFICFKLQKTALIRMTHSGISGSRSINSTELANRNGQSKCVGKNILKDATSRPPFTHSVPKFFSRIGLGLISTLQSKIEIAHLSLLSLALCATSVAKPREDFA